MTDGPYRSLPMTPSWKKAAQLLAQEASSQAEANEAVCKALRKDFRAQRGEELVALARDFLGQNAQGSLFVPSEMIEHLRQHGPIGPLAEGLFRHLQNGASLESAFALALKGEMACHLRSVEDGYHQALEAGETNLREVRHLVGKIGAAQRSIDCDALAREMISGKARSKPANDDAPDRLEEGPALR